MVVDRSIGNRKVDTKLLHRLFHTLSAPDAIMILCHAFEASTATVFIEGRQVRVADLLDSCYMFYGAIAADVEVRFYGGPPSRGQWFEGTLLTMVMDHAAFQVLRGDCKKISAALQWMNGRGNLITS
jgi:hypothetical protein